MHFEMTTFNLKGFEILAARRLLLELQAMNERLSGTLFLRTSRH